ncbi:MAG TPA: transglutaminase family protein [Sphingomonadaceae bacterium]
MTIEIRSRFSFSLPAPIDILLQFEAAQIPEQAIDRARTSVEPVEHFARVPAQDGIGERIWVRGQGRIEVSYAAQAQVRRQLADLPGLAALEPRHLPGETVQYLLPSLYCPAVRFQPFAEAEFGRLKGGARIAAIRDWVSRHFTYAPGSTNLTTALDSFVERRGICRDYAHVVITLARASGIPARYASVYAPGEEPQDFHAVAEVFLADPAGAGGMWHLVDATGMADPAEMVKIGVGRDAADVSFLSSFGACEFEEIEVHVSRAPQQNN